MVLTSPRPEAGSSCKRLFFIRSSRSFHFCFLFPFSMLISGGQSGISATLKYGRRGYRNRVLG